MWKNVFWLLLFYNNAVIATATQPSSYLSPIPIYLEGKLNEEIIGVVSRSKEILYRFVVNTDYANLRVHTQVDNSTDTDYPVTFVVRRRKISKSWQLPFEANGNFAYVANRTICVYRHMNSHQEEEIMLNTTSAIITIAVSSFSPTAAKFSLTVRNQCNKLETGQIMETQVGMATPQVFHFPPSQMQNFSSDVIVISLSSNDSECITVSVQSPECPVQDLETNVYSHSQWQTMTHGTSVAIQRHKYPTGFFLVLVLNETPEKCKIQQETKSSESHFNSGTKIVHLMLQESISDTKFLWAWLWPIIYYYIILITFYFFFGLLVCSTSCILKQEVAEVLEIETFSEHQQATSQNVLIQTNLKNHVESTGWGFRLSVLTIAAFYGIPALRNLLFYRYTYLLTGNHDVCRTNNKCAYPLGIIPDSFSFYSNFGYIIVSIIQLMNLTIYQKVYQNQRNKLIRPGFDLSYAICLSIFCTGVFSAIYQLCPNPSMVHPDTSFVCVTVTLTIMKLYKTQKPFVILSPYQFTISMALLLLLLYTGEWINHWVFLAAWTITHIATVFYVWRILAPNNPILILVWIVNIGIAAYLIGVQCKKPSLVLDYGDYAVVIFGFNFLIYLNHYFGQNKHNKCSLIISQFYLSISGIFWLVAVVMLVLIRFSSEYPDPVAGQFTDLCGNDKLTQAYDLQDQWRIHSALAILFTANALEIMDTNLHKEQRKNDEVPRFKKI